MKVSRVCIGLQDEGRVCGQCLGREVGPGLVGIVVDDEGGVELLCDKCLSEKDYRHAAVLFFLLGAFQLVESGGRVVQMAGIFARRLRQWGYMPRSFGDGEEGNGHSG